MANSNTVKQRIKKFYRKPAIIINPPIDLPLGCHSDPPWAEKNLAKRKNFYLTGGRLARAKRYDIAIKACNKLKLPLKIFGRDFANLSQELKSIAGPTIEFLGEITQKQKKQLFQQAKALFFCSDNEDFGMLPLEAMAYGCPVIAYKSGGAEETVIDGKTGIFFHKLTPTSCITAIKKFQKMSSRAKSMSSRAKSRDLSRMRAISKTCHSRAQQFNKQKFISKIKHLFF
ncbi:glycosyltransferase [Patescibacteria group bacterium]|nr:glycosyltransferase [Patescibacteria group bacterium]